MKGKQGRMAEKGIRFEADCDCKGTHMHEEMEILFVLAGRLAVFTGGRNFVVEQEGVVVFNPFEMHELYREGHTLSLYILFGLLAKERLGKIFCISSLQPEKEAFFMILKEKLAALLLEYQSPGDDKGFYLCSRLYALIGILHQEFRLEQEEPLLLREADREFLSKILVEKVGSINSY